MRTRSYLADNMMNLPSTLIITGAFGSGKTECAMALAEQAAQGGPAALVDLDFVNPYFRAQDHRAALEARGVRIIAPDPHVAPIDAPAMPAAAAEAMIHPTGCTIVDLGGDPAGAVVIGQFAPLLHAYAFWAVVNFARPTTPDAAHAAALLQEIARVTRLQLTGIISNTHLGALTEAEDILQGLAQARELGELLHLPVRLLAVPAGVSLPPQAVPVLEITPRLRRPWERSDEN
ncbi:MAG TPA: ParA family protein [Armatimonadota bacterium]|jgi:hypothetical protein